MTSPIFPEPPPPLPPTPADQIVGLLTKLSSKKDAWAKTSTHERIRYLERLAAGVQREAEGWALTMNRAKGIDPTSSLAGEDWLAGPMTTARNIRLLVEALKQGGQPRPPKLSQRKDGQWVARVFPGDLLESIAYTGWSADVWIEPGKSPSQGAHYREKPTTGKVALVLGAGNVSSIGPMDVLYKMFVDGEACVLKMNPVNEVSGPHIERAFSALIDDGFFGVVYGGADVGKLLTDHPLVDNIHITGSDRTHDAIIWGATPDEQAKNKANKTPRLDKPISSELGCVTPVIVVPGDWTDAELDFQARHVAGMVAQNGSFNCNAAKCVVLARGWDRREKFLGKLEDALRAAPARKAYYPGAQQRYQNFLDRYPKAKVLGQQGEGIVPWTLLPDVPAKKGEYALTNEAFCGVLAEVSLEASGARDFLGKAVAFCNDELWGTLSCMVLIDPRTEKQNADAFDAAIADLRYGGIAINGWAGAIYGLGVTTWGAFPGHTLEEIVSGRGTVHNTYLFDHPQKSVLRMPFIIKPTPLWMADHRNLKGISSTLTRFENDPGFLGLPGVILQALRS